CPPPTVRFTGRGDILDEMSQYFNTYGDQRHIFLLHGLGGTGKSQIAFKFIEQSKSRFSEVYFVDSSSEQTIENDLATIALAKKFGKDFEVTLRWLAQQQTEWLILFNNADDINLNLGRYFPAGSHGNILITSRNPDLGQHAYREYKVDRMQLEEAIDLLLSAARHDVSVPENRQIGRQLRLHCLPLAVAQAGAYISSSRALARYLELYETTTKRIQLLNQRPPQSDYKWSVYTTWQISFEKLSPQAAELLQLCSFIHHDGITEQIFQEAASYQLQEHGPTEIELQEPLRLLATFRDSVSNWDSMKFMPLTNELGRYSLIEFQATSRYITFSIHPLVHEWSRTSVNSEATLELCMHRLLGMSISSPTANFQFKHQIFPHLDALSFVNTSANRQANVVDIAFADQWLWVYYEEGKYSTLHAKDLETQVLEKRIKILGEDHPDTLISMSNLAIGYSRLGEFQRSKDLGTQVLEKRTTILGEDHPDTLWSMANLAVRYSQLGEFHRAKELETQVLEKRTKILGEDHPDTLWSMANLAVYHSQLGDFCPAKELETTVLKKRTETLGEDHPGTLKSMGNLAMTYTHLGHLTSAQQL
ncbi:P-loop containing nucleoside triphosphate hydrolase protein, partial [Mycena rosella]